MRQQRRSPLIHRKNVRKGDVGMTLAMRQCRRAANRIVNPILGDWLAIEKIPKGIFVATDGAV
jgi:hypothetical protein